jgi:hypothetical protein
VTSGKGIGLTLNNQGVPEISVLAFPVRANIPQLLATST